MDGGDVCAYLDANQIEAEITAAVAACVEQGAAQPLAYLARRLAIRAVEVAIDFDYKALCAELKELVRANACGKELVRLSWHDAATFSMALGGGGPNAAMRFQEGGEAAFEVNEGLDGTIALLAPLKAKYPNISQADLWTLAANVAVEELCGPAITTRFGRLDADSAADSVESQLGRLPTEQSAVHLREIFYAKGFNDRATTEVESVGLLVPLCWCHRLLPRPPPSEGFGSGRLHTPETAPPPPWPQWQHAVLLSAAPPPRQTPRMPGHAAPCRAMPRMPRHAAPCRASQFPR